MSYILEYKYMEERSKNQKRVEAGKKLAEKNKEIKEFYIKNTKSSNSNYIIIGVVVLLGIGYYFYQKTSEIKTLEIQKTPEIKTPEITRKSKHILYECISKISSYCNYNRINGLWKNLLCNESTSKRILKLF